MSWSNDMARCYSKGLDSGRDADRWGMWSEDELQASLKDFSEITPKEQWFPACFEQGFRHARTKR